MGDALPKPSYLSRSLPSINMKLLLIESNLRTLPFYNLFHMSIT